MQHINKDKLFFAEMEQLSVFVFIRETSSRPYRAWIVFLVKLWFSEKRGDVDIWFLLGMWLNNDVSSAVIVLSRKRNSQKVMKVDIDKSK